jgi:hypothetical protein
MHSEGDFNKIVGRGEGMLHHTLASPAFDTAAFSAFLYWDFRTES